MARSRVYRARRDQGWLLVAIATPLLAVGVGLIPDGGKGTACCSGVMGGAIALIGVSHLGTRVEVGPRGVAKRPWVPGRLIVPWEAVESWSVVRLRDEDAGDNFSHRAVRFVVGCQRQEMRESEVHRPGFEAFLADVRAWAGDREFAGPGAAPDPTEKSGGPMS